MWSTMMQGSVALLKVDEGSEMVSSSEDRVKRRIPSVSTKLKRLETS